MTGRKHVNHFEKHSEVKGNVSITTSKIIKLTSLNISDPGWFEHIFSCRTSHAPRRLIIILISSLNKEMHCMFFFLIN